jgi:PilZ domain-containing protein
MNPSANKRKMPRMQVDLPACIFWGVANKSWEVNIRNMSIHGLSFQSSRYFSQGTPFELIFPEQKKDLKRKKIHAVVVRCETRNGFATDKFKIGAKFLFDSKFFAESKKIPALQKNSTALKPLRPLYPSNITHQGEVIDLGKEGTQPPPACTFRVGEIRAEFLQLIQTSQNKETIQTLIKIKESRFITSHHISASTVNLPENFLEDLPETTFLSSNTLGKFPAKQLPDRR